jgi:hypothetical protein
MFLFIIYKDIQKVIEEQMKNKAKRENLKSKGKRLSHDDSNCNNKYKTTSRYYKLLIYLISDVLINDHMYDESNEEENNCKEPELE